MALIKCPECSKEISNKANYCPNCGYPTKKEYLGKPNYNVKDEISMKAKENANKDEGINKGKFILKILLSILIATIIFSLAPRSITNKFFIYENKKNENIRSGSLIEKEKLNEYNYAIKLYKEKKYNEALDLFFKLDGYERSNEYLNLLYIKKIDPYYTGEKIPSFENFLIFNEKKLEFSNEGIYSDLIRDLNFEDTIEILNNSVLLSELFLEGNWQTSNGEFFFTLININDNPKENAKWHSSYNFPVFAGDFYKIENGFYYTGNNNKWKKAFKYTIKSKDEIHIYNLKNFETYVMRKV